MDGEGTEKRRKDAEDRNEDVEDREDREDREDVSFFRFGRRKKVLRFSAFFRFLFLWLRGTFRPLPLLRVDLLTWRPIATPGKIKSDH